MFAQAVLALSRVAPVACNAQPSLRRPAAAAASAGRPAAARRAASALRLAPSAPGAARASRLPRLAAKRKPEPEPEPEAEEGEEDEEDFEIYEEGDGDEEDMELWQVALTVEASAATLPKGVTHGAFCNMVQETLKKCVPSLPSDKEMEDHDMFESSLLVVTDQEEDVPFNCDEDAVYVEMTFFDVNTAESAAHNAIQGLEAKGWQSEIVDPEDMVDDDEGEYEGEYEGEHEGDNEEGGDEGDKK